MNSNEERKVFLDALPGKVKRIISQKGNRERNNLLQEVCELLTDEVPEYNWVGFYFSDPDKERELVLGPYVGAPTEHIRIPYGRGICGQAAKTLETFVVDDVTAEGNYLACSPDVKSEVVVPIMKNDTFIGELDIDSHTKAGISPYDRKILERICNIISDLY